MKLISCLIGLCLVVSLGILQWTAGVAGPGCKPKMSIDYVGQWSEYYDACNSEMKTTFTSTVGSPGSYDIIWCQVDNTSFSKEYPFWLFPDGPVNVVEWTHCSNLHNHRLMMDIRPMGPIPRGFLPPYEFTAEYFAGTPGSPEGP